MKDNAVAPVTVIIPCYRCASTIRRAAASVWNQTQRPSALILVDDFSGDNTSTVLREIQVKYGHWVRIVEMPNNQGAASARNAGWHFVASPYLAFLDSDDSWHPEKVEIQLTYMNSHPEVVLSGHEFRVLTEEDTPTDWKLNRCVIENITKSALLISNRFITPSVMLRSDIPQRFRPNQRHMEDHMLWLEIIFGGGRVTKLSLPLAAIYKQPFGASGLSSQMWAMEKGDLGNYRRLYLLGHIGWVTWFGLSAFSCAKLIRRLVIRYGGKLRAN